MSDFEFLLSLFGLLLGFTLVEVLGGLVRVTKALRTRTGEVATEVRIGWLTPILAIFVILDIASYWVNVWWIRDSLTVGFDTVFGGLLIAGSYYFAASMIFPDEARDWPKLDEWFWLHRRQVIGPLLIVNDAWVTTTFILLSGPDIGFPWQWIAAQSIYFGALGIAFFTRRPVLVAVALGLLSTMYLTFGLIEVITRLRLS